MCLNECTYYYILLTTEASFVFESYRHYNIPKETLQAGALNTRWCENFAIVAFYLRNAMDRPIVTLN